MRGGNSHFSVNNHKAGQHALGYSEAARKEAQEVSKGKFAAALAALQKGSSRRRRRRRRPRRTMKKMH